MADSKVKSRATKAKPCPVCGEGTKGCSELLDGAFWCRGEPRGGFKRVKEGGEFHTYRREDDNRHARNGKHGGPKVFFGESPVEWPKLAREYAGKMTPERRKELAAHLGLPVASLGALPDIGYNADRFGPHYTFPETEAGGTVVGINRRYLKPVEQDGEQKNKLMMKGSKHGLYIGAEWVTRHGPVFCPEGASDLLALHVCGLAAVARFSARGGVRELVELFRSVPRDRDIIIVGENDERPSKVKPGNEWPGRDGAEATAVKLSTELNRPVKWTLPPAAFKDSRELVQSIFARGATVGSVELYAEVTGQLTTRATTVGNSADTAYSASGWPAPVPLSQMPDVPAFPVDALPGWVEDYVRAQATELQVPPDLPALLVLGALAGGISRKVVVSPWEGWPREPTNLFVMPTLPPGERKSQTFNKVFAPISDLERDLQAEKEPAVAESDSAIRILLKTIENLETKIAKID